MNRSLLILLGALAVGAAVFAGAFFAGQRTGMLCDTRATDELGWLQDEFHLSAAEMTRIRELHQGYEPKCMEMCARVAEKKRELETALGNGTNVSADAQKMLGELGALRAQCQAQMLQHFITVSQAMPPAEGRRYLDEMKRLTLGFHEDIEQSMSKSAGDTHGHQ